MDLLEHQGKELLARYGLPTPAGEVAFTADEAVAAAERLGLPVVVKAQVHIGGRGKAGGVKSADDLSAVREHAEDILGLDISGHVVRRLWIERASDIAEEYYVSFSLDRSARKHLGILSAKGGMDIESVAEEDPDAIAKIWVDPVDGLGESDCRAWVGAARISEAAVDGTVAAMLSLYGAYVESDADLVEVNPLVFTSGGDMVALDAKITIDANSLFRHSDYSEKNTTPPRSATIGSGPLRL